MRYLSSISLALVVHVLLSIVVLMALACTATPTATPTPSGPMYSEEEAIAVLKEHLQAKPLPIPSGAPPGVTCFTQIDSDLVTWSGKYDNLGHRWDISVGTSSFMQKLLGETPTPPKNYTWSVYERTKSIVATGDEWLNQVC